MSIEDDKVCAHARLHSEYNAKRMAGVDVLPGVLKEVTHEARMDMEVQFDVLSVDPFYDTNGYTIVDKAGTHHLVSKSDYTLAIFKLKEAGLNLWKEWKALDSQVEGCTTIEELDALTFGG